MNDIVEVNDEQSRSLKNIGHVSYLLHLIVAIGAAVPGVQASIVLLIVAFVLDMVKRDEARGTWQESHFRWRIRTVLWAGGLYVITLPLYLLIIPGFVAWWLISVWFLYRIVRGWLNLSNNTPMPT